MSSCEGLKLEQVRNTVREFRIWVSHYLQSHALYLSFVFLLSPDVSSSVLNSFTVTYKAVNYIDQGAAQFGPQHLEQTLSGLHSGPFRSVLCFYSSLLCALLLTAIIYHFSWGDILEPLTQFAHMHRETQSQEFRFLKQIIAQRLPTPLPWGGTNSQDAVYTLGFPKGSAENRTLSASVPLNPSFSSLTYFPHSFPISPGAHS